MPVPLRRQEFPRFQGCFSAPVSCKMSNGQPESLHISFARLAEWWFLGNAWRYEKGVNFARVKLSDYYAKQESNSDRRSSIRSPRPNANVLGTRGGKGQGTEPARSKASGSISPVVSSGSRLGEAK